MTAPITVALFAGPGGACEGILDATGAHPVGIERDPVAVATRDAAGHVTIVADLGSFSPCELDVPVAGLWASPPCPAFSSAGKREGHDDLGHLCYVAAHPPTWNAEWHRWAHPDSGLIVAALQWVEHHRPKWVAFEQVPDVLPVWRAAVRGLGRLGYSAWAGILNAADYGVPQTRRRAFLMASTERKVQPPHPTHAEHPEPVLFGPELAPWATMADALGWSGEVGFPRRDDTGASDDGYRERDWFPTSGPAPHVTEKVRSWSRRSPGPGEQPRRVRIVEGAVLQGFPRDYPFAGSHTGQCQQLGNAVPPPMASAIVRELTGGRR